MGIGDIVSWTSQAGGFSKMKTGVIVDFVKPYSVPDEKYKLHTLSMRKTTSYVVQVGNKYYWPHRSKLQAA